MPNLKAVKKRISSTISTQQITKAMKLVSATKLRKAQMAITQMRPYADRLHHILMDLHAEVGDDPGLKAYFEYREPKKALIVAISSDRGLCGAFNSNVIKSVRKLIDRRYANTDIDYAVKFLGKKAYDYFKKLSVHADTNDMDIFNRMDDENIFGMEDDIVESFLNGTYDEVWLVYNSFKNAATQVVVTEKLLPVEMEKLEADPKAKNEHKADYIFEPNKRELLGEVIPRAVKTQVYKAILDSSASEHGARMVSMDKATENAGEMLRKLRLQYNQARQAAITTELSEIVGGAAALEG